MTAQTRSLFRAVASLLLAGSLAACVGYGGGYGGGGYRYGGGYAPRAYTQAWHGGGYGGGFHRGHGGYGGGWGHHGRR